MYKFYDSKAIGLDQTLKTTGDFPLSAVVLEILATNRAGATAVLGDLGNVRIELADGTQVGEMPVATLSQITQLFFGFAPFASAIGGAVSVTVVFPFRYKINRFDTNAIQQMLLVTHFGANMAVLDPAATSSVRLHGITTSSGPLYLPRLHRYTDTLRSTIFEIDEENTIWLAIPAPAGGVTVTKVVAERDGRIIHNASLPEIIHGTDLMVPSTGASRGIGLMPFVGDENFALLKSSKCLLDITTGVAGAGEYWVYAAQKIYGSDTPRLVPAKANHNVAPASATKFSALPRTSVRVQQPGAQVMTHSTAQSATGV